MTDDELDEWYDRMQRLGEQPRTVAQKVVVAILADLGDRRGIKHALGDIDADVIEELLSTLVRKVEEVLGE